MPTLPGIQLQQKQNLYAEKIIFCIKKDYFRWTGLRMSIVLKYSFQTYNASGTFSYNDADYILDKDYNKVELLYHPSEIDILFSIKSDVEKVINIKWWNDNLL